MNPSNQKTVQELEIELKQAKQAEYEKKRLDKQRKEKEFKELNKTDVYYSDDYAGMNAGKYSFYFGYEQTYCPEHSNKNCEDNGCELREWCFTADMEGREVMRIPASKLWFEHKDVLEYLLLGIGKFMESNL